MSSWHVNFTGSAAETFPRIICTWDLQKLFSDKSPHSFFPLRQKPLLSSWQLALSFLFFLGALWMLLFFLVPLNSLAEELQVCWERLKVLWHSTAFILKYFHCVSLLPLFNVRVIGNIPVHWEGKLLLAITGKRTLCLWDEANLCGWHSRMLLQLVELSQGWIISLNSSFTPTSWEFYC